MPASDTKTTILDAAEDLFAEQGFAATSLRQLTTRAGVNLAAVNYHFGSKDDLLVAVLLRRIGPINEERVRRLDAMERPATIEAVVRAFIEPAMQSVPQASGFCRVFGRINAEQPPFLRGFFHQQFGELAQRFVAMLQEAAPALDVSTVWWRLHFTVGAMAHTLHSGHVIAEVSGGSCNANDPDRITEELVRFALGGFETNGNNA